MSDVLVVDRARAVPPGARFVTTTKNNAPCCCGQVLCWYAWDACAGADADCEAKSAGTIFLPCEFPCIAGVVFWGGACYERDTSTKYTDTLPVPPDFTRLPPDATLPPPDETTCVEDCDDPLCPAVWFEMLACNSDFDDGTCRLVRCEDVPDECTIYDLGGSLGCWSVGPGSATRDSSAGCTIVDPAALDSFETCCACGDAGGHLADGCVSDTLEDCHASAYLDFADAHGIPYNPAELCCCNEQGITDAGHRYIKQVRWTCQADHPGEVVRLWDEDVFLSWNGITHKDRFYKVRRSYSVDCVAGTFGLIATTITGPNVSSYSTTANCCTVSFGVDLDDVDVFVSASGVITCQVTALQIEYQKFSGGSLTDSIRVAYLNQRHYNAACHGTTGCGPAVPSPYSSAFSPANNVWPPVRAQTIRAMIVAAAAAGA